MHVVLIAKEHIVRVIRSLCIFQRSISSSPLELYTAQVWTCHVRYLWHYRLVTVRIQLR